jgi:hypothetical protein
VMYADIGNRPPLAVPTILGPSSWEILFSSMLTRTPPMAVTSSLKPFYCRPHWQVLVVLAYIGERYAQHDSRGRPA